jgi:hypothetical protein
MKLDEWLETREFIKSDDIETIVSMSLPKKDVSKFAELYPNKTFSTIKCRLVKVPLSTGEVEILCTSLLNTNKYPYEEFCSLYHYCWNHEEAYKLLKSRAELENFSGKTASED